MPSSTSPLISSAPELSTFLSSIPASSTLYLDLEGTKLCRHGTISVITILIHPSKEVRIIDVLTLGDLAFTTPSKDGKTLKAILEDPNIPKCFWDVRNDADALWALYKVGLAGVTDVQLLENAFRFGDKTYIRGLVPCIRYDLKASSAQVYSWLKTKDEVTALMTSNVFEKRPLDEKTLRYCVNDVLLLPELYDVYVGRLGSEWIARVVDESAKRITEAHAAGYDPQSPSKRLGPWGNGYKK